MKSKKCKEPRPPRPLAWVKLDSSGMAPEWVENYTSIFGRSDFLLYMGEMPNQRGHCVIYCPDQQKMHVGFHIENFIEMTDDEV